VACKQFRESNQENIEPGKQGAVMTNPYARKSSGAKQRHLNNKFIYTQLFKIACFIFVFWTAAAATAQTVTTLLNFDITNGGDPFAGLIQAADGNFYGVTAIGGTGTDCTNGCGTVFQITTAGTLTTLHSFQGTDGSGSQGGLIQATNGVLYGTTYAGGTNGDGTVFSITTAGALTTLHNFSGTDGRAPASTLVQATNGDIYGTTNFGGSDDDGTIFKINPGGTLTTVHSFEDTDGFLPIGALIEAIDGNLYGTTMYGGSSKACLGGCGTVFKFSLSGTLTTLHSFDDADGNNPISGLIQANDGIFYGTTNFGGSGAGCQTACGTIFRITPGGKLTSLYNFAGFPYGAYGGLVLGTDGNIYGTTQASTVFSMTPAGALTTLFTFDFYDGFEPLAPMIQGTDGNFYGTTYQGAEYFYGNVFVLSVGLGPFVKTNPTSGKVGTGVTILGSNFTGTTAVKFNGTAASFKIVSSTEIAASVPAGATSGTVEVVTSEGTLESNVPFRVVP
jgi:uncharacterized repeat protein (TIGR03803 family)